MTSKTLQDQSVVVLGGTAGIGRAVARAAVREGARVTVLGRSAAADGGIAGIAVDANETVSLGGAMAARYAGGHQGEVRGLVLWAAYPDGDLSGAPIEAVSVYGTNDGLIPADCIDQSRGALPAEATLAPIEGGNHAQFGWYGEQAGDAPAAIGREEQQAAAVAATAALLALIAR